AQMSTARRGADDETLYAAWAIGQKDVWFGGTRGSAGLLVHFDGAHFVARDFGTSAVPVSLWGAAPNDVWVVVAGASGTTDILHWEGAAWSPPFPVIGLGLPLRVRDIYGQDATRVFAVGDDGVIVRLGTAPDGTRAFVREATVSSTNPFDPSLHYF